VSYADDSYVIVSDNSMEGLLRKTKDTIDRHLLWLRSNGMVCNVSKTELMVMNFQEYLVIEVDQNIIQSSKSMRVLGLTFDSALEWTTQVDNCVAKSNRMLHGLKHIKKGLNQNQVKQVITAYFFSVLMYGCGVWFHRHLFFHLKQRVRASQYRALRLVYGKQRTRDEINVMAARATPDEWADYSIAKMSAKIANSMMPCRLHVDLMLNSFVERRHPHLLLFYDSSCRKIGRQSIKNRLTIVAKQMKFDWFSYNISPDLLRIRLKHSFFSYSRFQ